MRRLPGRKLVRRALQPLSRALFPGAIVLGYHRVSAVSWDPLGLAVAPDRFAAQLEVLQELRDVVGLRELVARRAAGERLERYAALTFDDGYRDFPRTALPILERLGAPATVFVATGSTGRSFWWEEIAAVLASDRPAAPALEIARDGQVPRRYEGLDQAERRAALARELCARLVCAGEADIRHMIAQLQAWAGGGEPTAAPGVPMSRSELQMLARHPLVEIGAHTVGHGCLAELAPETQRREIEQSKTDLESVTRTAVTLFSYPNGSYRKETPRLVRALGFAGACTSEEGTFSRRTDPYRIPRVWASDADRTSFRGWLGRWVAGARR